MTNRTKIFLFSYAFSICILYNEINRNLLAESSQSGESKNATSLVHNGTIWSIDNFWYLTQSRNYLDGKGLMLDPQNAYTAVRRTPGYPIFYMLHVYLLGEKSAHRVLPYTQSFLFALSCLALALAVFNFTEKERLAILSGIIYGCNPFASGYTYYTITEAIHPAFVIFGFYFFSRAHITRSYLHLLLTGVFFSIATLIRPLNGILLAVIFPIIFLNGTVPFLSRVKWLGILVTGFLILILPWTIRNYIVTGGDVVVLEKFYNEDPMHKGKKQWYLSKWWMCWGNPRQELFIDSLRHEIILGTDGYIDRFISQLPDRAIQGYTDSELKGVLNEYKACMQFEISARVSGKYYGPNEILPQCEDQVASEFTVLTKKFREDSPIDYFLISPLFVRGKEFVLTSFSSMYGSLSLPIDKGSTLQKVVKAFMYLFNAGLFLSFILFLFSKRCGRDLKNFVILFCLSTFFFVVYFLHIEGRYFLAAYPFLCICAAVVVSEIFSVIEKFRNR
ncbi:MAG: glycosyltransferase family 39 protein [Bacteroidia bacterium]|nr:glycosyltransferase family 39 protein [Bacteroidia bacterium]